MARVRSSFRVDLAADTKEGEAVPWCGEFRRSLLKRGSIFEWLNRSTPCWTDDRVSNSELPDHGADFGRKS